jgi:glycosyltransferase involved in cell wall biosynthesis
MISEPFISLLTPVFNGAKYLEQCIASVLSQTYCNFEYIIINNCSTDQSLNIALAFAKTDHRIQVRSNSAFVGVIENHNIAFKVMSPDAKYCKVISADDFLFPECLAEMVELAERHPSVGIVGSYQLSGDIVKWQGFQYPAPSMPGLEVGRQVFLRKQVFVNGKGVFGFGTPTSLLYRADLVRSSDLFYPNSSPQSDTSACFEQLQQCDFGFVYQVLSYERVHSETETTQSESLNRHLPAYLNDLLDYGDFYFTKAELRALIRTAVGRYYRFLIVSYITRKRDRRFWNYHLAQLRDCGLSFGGYQLIKAALFLCLEALTRPGFLGRRLLSKDG